MQKNVLFQFSHVSSELGPHLYGKHVYIGKLHIIPTNNSNTPQPTNGRKDQTSKGINSCL